jgi:hypothetical protein
MIIDSPDFLPCLKRRMDSKLEKTLTPFQKKRLDPVRKKTDSSSEHRIALFEGQYFNITLNYV